MLINKVKMNLDKTDFLPVETERQQNKYLSMFPIELFGVETNPAKSACNLGVILENISPSAHLYPQSAAHIFVCYLWRIRRYLDLKSAKLFANAPVSFHLDYCSSLLSDIADTDPTKLQRFQNRLTCVVTK